MALLCNTSDPMERVCIQTNRVFDACLKTITLQDITIAVPITTVYATPLTYIGARSSATSGTIRNLTVTPIANTDTARVTGITDIPLTVTFTDAGGTQATGPSTVSVPFDIILTLPTASVMPYNIEAVVSASSEIGTYVSTTTTDYTFTIDICIAMIVKLVMQVELIVASYGYAVIPPCTDFGDQVCEGFFGLPLYPDNTIT